MPVYALLQNGKVAHTFVADSVDSLGETGILYDVLDVTTVFPRPGVNWTFDGTTWKLPRQTGDITPVIEVTVDDLVVPVLEDSGKSKK